MDDTKIITDSTAIMTAPICISCDYAISEDMTATATYNRRIENNLPFPPTDKEFVGALGLNGEFYRFTKKR